ncbi:MAG: CoA transferase [Pseudonocardiales bacterium]
MPGPLEGTLVVDLSRALAGPHAAQMLGDLGARVIKLENPAGGDDSRGWGPPFVDAHGVAEHGESTYFFSCNRNKESVTADLKSADGVALLHRLLRHSDVLVENFRTGVLDRLGFSAGPMLEINPRLIVLSITGFGHDGPEGGRPGYDQIAQGEGGIMSLTGTGPADPQRVGVPIADLLAGMYGAYGVVAALHERDRTGRGTVVRTSLLAAMVGVHAFQGTRYTVAGEVAYGQGNHHPSIAPYGAFACADGIIQIAVGSQALWQRFAVLVGLDPADQRFAMNAERVRHREALVSEIEAAFAAAPLAHWLPALAGIGIPAGRVRSLDQVYDWDQTRSQQLLVDVEHSTAGPLTLPGVPLRFDSGGRIAHLAPPTLGQHNHAVRAWLDGADAAQDPPSEGPGPWGA